MIVSNNCDHGELTAFKNGVNSSCRLCKNEDAWNRGRSNHEREWTTSLVEVYLITTKPPGLLEGSSIHDRLVDGCDATDEEGGWLTRPLIDGSTCANFTAVHL